jgi:hypothetical protein
VARGGFAGGNSTDELVLAGLLARSKLSPLTLCPGFKFVEPLDPRLGLRAGGPKAVLFLSVSTCIGAGFDFNCMVFRSYLSRM